ncbi:uncharacterized protein LOC124155947 isoform X2 [Ischnura elegans]|uniref:uncharacterized protein LOC124155947 isoform X2 n=1 Tax=Ischnura elegans TaxID=197161 RepID=UPI001ED8A320|nr:uncharacterized protein LOC124155947 isoform X2 [Ischnura elegans]
MCLFDFYHLEIISDIECNMDSVDDNINALIENIKISEHYAEAQRNELNAVEIEISRIKSEIMSINLEKQELENDLNKILTEVDKKEATLICIEKEIKILKDVNKELKDTYERENKVLCEKQQEVWSNRELFCNNLRQFAEDWGPLSSKFTNKNIQALPAKEKISDDLKTLEESIVKAKEELSAAENNLMKAKLLKEKLIEEPEWGEEFMSLQACLRKTQLEVEVLEKQLELEKQEQCRKPKDSRQLMFFPEPPLHHSTNTKSASLLGACSSYYQERSHAPMMDKKFYGGSCMNDLSSINKFVVKRPVAAIAPAIDLSQQEKIDDEFRPSDPKKACTFIPKKPSSLSKKFFTHSNSWSQLEKELSDLLRKDLPKS